MAILLLLFAISGNREEIHDHFDMLEVNHFHNRYGSVVFVQLIYWDWHDGDRQFRAQGWKVMEDAFDTSDAEHKQEYEAEIDRRLQHISDVGRRSWIRRQLTYKGKFIGGRLYPTRQHRTGKYLGRFYDKKGVVRVITSDLFRETYTNKDPEVQDRKLMPVDARRGLTPVEVHRQRWRSNESSDTP